MCSERRRRSRLFALFAAISAGCSFVPPPTRPCPALPASTWPLPVARDVPLGAVLDANTDAAGETRGTLVADGERVAFRVRRSAPAASRPMVLLVPILAGGEELLDQVGNRLLAAGYDVASCARAGRALRVGDRGPELETLFARTVLHQRLLLRWLRAGDANERPYFVLGISLGGMVATVLAAQEPDLRGIAVCLSGGDLAGLIQVSSERRVQDWRAARFRMDGVGDDHLQWELATYLRHEPLRFAPSVATERVLFVSADFDTVVPRRHQDLLWEALGRPARLRVPLGHYSSALLLDGIVAAVIRYFDTRRSVDPATP